MICRLDLPSPPSSLRPDSNKGTVGTEIKLPSPGYLPILEVKPQSKRPANPAASKPPARVVHSVCHPQNSYRDQPPALPAFLRVAHLSVPSLIPRMLVNTSLAPGCVLALEGVWS